MTYLVYDPMTTETRPPRLFRYSASGAPDAERWDPISKAWVALGWPSIVSDELDRGSYGMRIPDDNEVAEITGGVVDPMIHSEALVWHVCECGDRFAERRFLEAHLSVADLMRGHHAAVPDPDPTAPEHRLDGPGGDGPYGNLPPG